MADQLEFGVERLIAARRAARTESLAMPGLALGAAFTDDPVESMKAAAHLENLSVLKGRLEEADDWLQASVFSQLARSDQDGLRGIGYKEARPISLNPVFNVVEGFNTVLRAAHHVPLLDQFLTSLSWGSEQIHHVVRAAMYAEREAAGRYRPGASGNENLFTNPLRWHWAEAFDRTDDNEVTFYSTPSAVLKNNGIEVPNDHVPVLVDIIKNPDQKALIKRYGEDKLQEVIGNENFDVAVKTLEGGQLSPGRAIARSLGIHPGDAQTIVPGVELGPRVDPFKLYSGALDGLYTFYGDPLIVGGKLLSTARAARMARYSVSSAEDVYRIAEYSGYKRVANFVANSFREHPEEAVGRIYAAHPNLFTGEMLKTLSIEAPTTVEAFTDVLARRAALVAAGEGNALRYFAGAPVRLPVTASYTRAAKAGIIGAAEKLEAVPIVGRAGMTFRRMTNLLPRVESLNLLDPESFKAIEQMAKTVLPARDVQELITIYTAADLGGRKVVWNSLVSSIGDQLGLPDDFMKRYIGAEDGAVFGREYGINQLAENLSAIKREDGTFFHAGIHNHQVSSPHVTLPKFREMVLAKREISAWRSIPGVRNIPVDLVDRAMTRVWKPNVLTGLGLRTVGFATRVAAEEWARALLDHGALPLVRQKLGTNAATKLEFLRSEALLAPSEYSLLEYLGRKVLSGLSETQAALAGDEVMEEVYRQYLRFGPSMLPEEISALHHRGGYTDDPKLVAKKMKTGKWGRERKVYFRPSGSTKRISRTQDDSFTVSWAAELEAHTKSVTFKTAVKNYHPAELVEQAFLADLPQAPFYHGTRVPFDEIKSIEAGLGDAEANLLGPGLYVTDTPEVAFHYQRTFQHPEESRQIENLIYGIDLDWVPGRVLDAETPGIPDDVAGVLRSYSEEYSTRFPFEQDDTFLVAYSEVKRAIRFSLIEQGDVNQALRLLNSEIRDLGYDAIRFSINEGEALVVLNPDIARIVHRTGDVLTRTLTPEENARRAVLDYLRSEDAQGMVNSAMRSKVTSDGQPALLEDALVDWADKIVESMKGLTHNVDGPIPEVLDALQTGRAPSIEDLARIEEARRPLFVVGREMTPIIGQRLENYTNFIFHQIGRQIDFIARRDLYVYEAAQVRKELRPAMENFKKTGNKHWQQIEDDLVQKIATDRLLPKIHDPSSRSQFAVANANLFPFYFAHEQWLKRWGKTLLRNPTAARRGQLIMMGFRHTGVIHKDEDGEEYFYYPGVAWVQSLLNQIGGATWGDSKVPVSIGLRGYVKYLSAGIGPSGEPEFLPDPGPITALPIAAAKALWPDQAVSFDQAIHGGKASDRPLWEQLVPSPLSRLARTISPSDSDANFASAEIYAAQVLTATGHGLSDDPTNEEIEDFKARVKRQARIIVLMRALYGYTGPASPKAEFSASLSPEYVALIESSESIEEAHAAFIERHPDASAFEVFTTTSTTDKGISARINPSVAVEEFFSAHSKFVHRYGGSAASWFMPDTPNEAFNESAWALEMAHEVRRRRGLDEIVEEIKSREAGDPFFKQRDAYYAVRNATASPEQRRVLDEAWTAHKDAYIRSHPFFAKRQAESRTNAFLRSRTLQQIETILADKDRPKTRSEGAMRELLEAYQAVKSIQRALGETPADRSTKQLLREGFVAYGRGLKDARARQMYQMLISPDVEEI